MENRDSVVVVTGASSGIGNACATFLAKKGNKVYGTCRNPSSYARKADEFFELLPMELTDPGSIAKVADRVYSAEGKVDALICCAGSGLVGSVEDTSLEEAESVLNVNYLGTLRTVKAFLPRMREAGKGRILLVAAVDGLVATPFQGLYSASEFALHGLAAALRIEVAAFGIEVGIISLSNFRTAFGRRRFIAAGAGESSPYKTLLDRTQAVLSADEAGGAEPLVAARAIRTALAARRVSPRRSAGPIARRILAQCRDWLPSALFERVLRKYYRLG
jgi:short-subunit dehydrogenase